MENTDNLLKEIEQKNIILKANELGFKIGDKVWNKRNKIYLGIIKDFQLLNNTLCYTTTSNNLWTLHNNITNKVAVHCSTKEDSEFINKLFNYIPHSIINDYNDCEPCILVNDKIWDNKTHLRLLNYLILSIDEYMQSQNIKPLFMTEDKVNIYNHEQTIYYIYTDKRIIIIN